MLPGSRPPSAYVPPPDECLEPHTRTHGTRWRRCRGSAELRSADGSGDRGLHARLGLGRGARRSSGAGTAARERAPSDTRRSAARGRSGASGFGRLESPSHGEVRVYGPRRSGPARRTQYGRSHGCVRLRLELGREHRCRIFDGLIGRERLARVAGSPGEHREPQLRRDRLRRRGRCEWAGLLGADLRHDRQWGRASSSSSSSSHTYPDANTAAHAHAETSTATDAEASALAGSARQPSSAGGARDRSVHGRHGRPERRHPEQADGDAEATDSGSGSREQGGRDKTGSPLEDRACLLQRAVPRTAAEGRPTHASDWHRILRLAGACRGAGQDGQRDDDRPAGSHARAGAVPHHRGLTFVPAHSARVVEAQSSF
jgi:hypothetical protein